MAKRSRLQLSITVLGPIKKEPPFFVPWRDIIRPEHGAGVAIELSCPHCGKTSRAELTHESVREPR